MQTSSSKNAELPLPDQDPVNSHRAWLCSLPADPAAVPVPVTITLDATTWAAVAHHARQAGETVDQVLSSFILDGGLGGIAEHIQASSRSN